MGLADISQLAKLQVAEKLQQHSQVRKAFEMAKAAQQEQPQTTVAQEALMEMGLGGLDVPEDMVSAAGGGIIGYAEGTDEEGVQTGKKEPDAMARAAIANAERTGDRQAMIDTIKNLVAAGYDVVTLVPRAFIGVAEDLANTRVGRALGVDFDASGITGSMTPAMDMLQRQGPQTASVAQQSASQAPDDKRPVLASVPESGTVLTEAQRKNLQNSENVKYDRVPPQAPPTQEEMDEAALVEAQRAGKAPGTDYGRPQYTTGNAPTFVSPVTPESYLAAREKAMAPGMAQIEQGFTEEQAANQKLIDAIKKAETQRQADIKAAGEYGAAQEKRAKERLEGIKGRKEDAKLSFIRDVSATLLTSPTSNFLSDLGLAVGKGGKAYDATVERIDAAKEKLQDSIDTIMEQRRGEKIANATDKRDADAALAKAQTDLAKLLANKRTKRGEMSMADAKDAVNQATSMAMTIAERQHTAQLSQYEAGERARLKMAEPESRDALQARITTLLASSDPALRALGRRLRDEAAAVTKAFTYTTPPGQVTPAVDLAARQDIMSEVYKEASKRASKFGMSLRKLSPEDRETAIQDEIDRRYGALMKRRATGGGGAGGGGGGGGAGGGGGGEVDPNNKFLK